MQEWWRGAVIYQVYPRSYQDSNGDGIGDLRGLIKRLPYIAELGVEAVWISPFVKSPQVDYGYDVSDYCDIDPQFGTLADFDALIATAHRLGLKIIMDQVWSHTSDQHLWFKESRSSRVNDKSDWYIWADAQPDGTPPNNWLSYFGGPAWRWDTRRSQYYLHHFYQQQPALNLRNPKVLEALFEVGKFWFERGVDGFRLDAAHTYLCHPELASNPVRPAEVPLPDDVPHSNPMARQLRYNSNSHPDIKPLLARLRQFSDQWPDRLLLGEIGGEDSVKAAASYVQPGLLHLAYSFRFFGAPFVPASLADVIQDAESCIEQGWLCWSTSNHDMPRVATRWLPPGADTTPAFAKLCLAFGLSLRGNYCIYQGEELGLPEADVPYEFILDGFGKEFYPEFKGRDGCRTPMPWEGSAHMCGFSTAERTWLPVDSNHPIHAVDVQLQDPESVLQFSRSFLKWRQAQSALRVGKLELIKLPAELADKMIAWTRTAEGQVLDCYFNLTAKPCEVPVRGKLLEGVGTAGQQQATLQLPAWGFAYLTQ